MSRRNGLLVFFAAGIIALSLFAYNIYFAPRFSANKGNGLQNTCTVNCVQTQANTPVEQTPLPVTPTSTAQTTSIPGYKLVWNDEFNGTQLDTSKWYAINSAGSAKQQGCCLNYSYSTLISPKQLKVHDGMLTITTERNKTGGPAYRTGAISTETLGGASTVKFKYGKLSIRAKLPSGKGVWPAMWLLTSPAANPPPYEIDMMEMLGQDPHFIYMVIHHNDDRYYCTYKGPDYSQDFHVYTLDWEPGKLTWSIDGQVLCSTKQYVPSTSMYLILNTALSDGSWGDAVSNSTSLPQTFDIDYVRIYTKQ